MVFVTVQQSAFVMFAAIWLASMATTWLALRHFRRYLRELTAPATHTAAAGGAEEARFAALDRVYDARLQGWAASGRQVRAARWRAGRQLELVFDDAAVFVFDECEISVDDLCGIVDAPVVSAKLSGGVAVLVVAVVDGPAVVCGRLLTPERVLSSQ